MSLGCAQARFTRYRALRVRLEGVDRKHDVIEDGGAKISAASSSGISGHKISLSLFAALVAEISLSLFDSLLAAMLVPPASAPHGRTRSSRTPSGFCYEIFTATSKSPPSKTDCTCSALIRTTFNALFLGWILRGGAPHLDWMTPSTSMPRTSLIQFPIKTQWLIPVPRVDSGSGAIKHDLYMIAIQEQRNVDSNNRPPDLRTTAIPLRSRQLQNN